ncbi:response regulator transcription factor [Desulfurispira natronophila]|uniref:CheY-like chemotaxis protein n=1 Tax=Desulfurispira natronophila TaxID=682562 RepID=A0A7W7Y2D7_9BACT|nr:response regulator [Desulfurispira natronophila]MBB5020797.1 CheY-like chemotaxis protein [Desulfurispira natronophila]
MNEHIPTEEELTGLFSILYVEDDEAINFLYQRMLKTLGFQRVWGARDGEEGLQLFQQVQPDIVLSDIMMPKMDGLEMVRNIRQEDAEVPVIMATAFDEKNYLMRSIEIGVDRYIVKPIDRNQFNGAIHTICRNLYERREAEEYARRKIQARINQATAQTLSEVANLFPNPAIIFSGEGKITFINDAFTTMLETHDLRRLSQGDVQMNDLLVKRDGYLSSLQDLEPADYRRNRILIHKGRINTIYQVASHQIALGEEAQLHQVYTFTNITRLEYEKHKSQNLARLLQENFRTRVCSNTVAETSTQASPGAGTSSDTPAVSCTTLLSNAELAVLRRSHLSKTSATEYVDSLDDAIVDQMEELSDVDFELEEHLIHLSKAPSQEMLDSIAQDVSSYARAIRQLVDFNDLAFALEQLYEIVSALDIGSIKLDKFIVLMESVRQDLRDWRTMVFVTREAQDIHYLDSSLFSSCLQFQLDFSADSDVADEGGDLELF